MNGDDNIVLDVFESDGNNFDQATSPGEKNKKKIKILFIHIMYVQTVLFYSIILFITFSLKFGLDFLCSYKFNLLSHSLVYRTAVIYLGAI